MADAHVLEIAGQEVPITSPGKVYFPESGETKLDLVQYYLRVGEPLMRTMGGRPVLMQRFPNGAGGTSFFQKRVPENAPEWLQTTTVETVNGTPSRALVAADLAHVAWAVNLGCLGFHVWPALAADPAHADELRLDLDPQPGTDFTHVREAAAELKRLLDEVGIAGFPKTTGNRGLHVYVRLQPKMGLLRRCAPRRWPSRASSPGAGRTSSPTPGGRRSAASASSSTSTRTRRTRRSSARGRRARAWAARSRCRSAGRTSSTSIPTS